ncbi:e4dd224c-13fa-4708-a570-b05291d130ce [Sclerotinia trifoliorum]|uniref:E4dd224c-13fa-4708-a570-b05291d130ce n=1 Tax=Sclerotinia trifoliorum TaxID=28548 RepID=A0A8H2VM65_9HELO|nr:e4dd224c-13fa-4708-a570-b05291d130ce [Sclerotinia trifoliorum]
MDLMPTRNHRRLFARRNGFKLGHSKENLLLRTAIISNNNHRITTSESKSNRKTDIKRHSKPKRQTKSERTDKRIFLYLGWKIYITSLKPSLSKHTFFLQKQLSIYLYAYSHINTQLCTPLPVETLESYRYIEPASCIDKYDQILEFQDILNSIEISPKHHIDDCYSPEMKLDIINKLEEVLVSTISHLHIKHISYPIKNTQQLFFVYNDSIFKRTKAEKQTFRLLLGYNEHASWVSDSLSSTWRSDEIEHARSLFRLPKVLSKLRDSPNRISVDAQDQHLLVEYLTSKGGHWKHFNLCSEKIAFMTPELTQCISFFYAERNENMKARVIFDAFFHKYNSSSVPLPPLSSRRSPLEICAFYRKILRQGQDTMDGDKYKVTNTPSRSATHDEEEDGLDKSPLNNDFLKADFRCLEGEQDEEDSITTISNKSLARLIYIRTQMITSHRSGREEKLQWWFLALTLYDAFLSDTPPRSYEEYICAGDAHGYRRMMMENDGK